jgi:hypothetical protein
LAADGVILVAGNTGLSYRDSNFPIVVRRRSDGTPDHTVGSLRPGVVYFGRGDSNVLDMALDRRSGRVYLAGGELGNQLSFLAIRLRPVLGLDTSFSGDGLVTTFFAGTEDFATSVLVDARGRALLAGTAAGEFRGSYALARFTTAGALDRSFGRRGRIRMRFGRAFSVARDLLAQRAGRVVAVGSTGSWPFIADAAGSAVTVARILAR